tara:strand:+ start:1023 stop:1433 length:411 start_codon:yes stop_codon:yes gene_type:complete
VKREGRLLIIEGRGPWNLEALKHSESRAQEILKKLAGKPWGVIATIYGEPIHVPEAEQRLIDLVKQDISNGRVASALIVKECDTPNFAKSHIGSIYEKAGCNVGYFDNFEEAKAWVEGIINSQNSSLSKSNTPKVR